MLAASFVPLYVSIRAKLVGIRILSLLLGSFALVHGIAHLFITLGFGFVESVLVWSVSIGLILSFGIYYYLKGG